MQQKERKERRKEEREGERESREGGIEGRKFKNIPGIWFLHYTRNRHAYFNCIGQVLSSLRLILSPWFFTVYDVPSLRNNLKQNHCAVQQKLTPHCKSTILHQKLKKKKKNSLVALVTATIPMHTPLLPLLPKFMKSLNK